jgi:hypothetical protein
MAPRTLEDQYGPDLAKAMREHADEEQAALDPIGVRAIRANERIALALERIVDELASRR